MGDPSIRAWVARIVGAVLIVLVVFVLFWPILVERQTGAQTATLSAACTKLVAHMRQQPTGGAGFTQAVAHPECWSAEVSTPSIPLGERAQP
jgi:glycerol uptake facilitator-like aquaporin